MFSHDQSLSENSSSEESFSGDDGEVYIYLNNHEAPAEEDSGDDEDIAVIAQRDFKKSQENTKLFKRIKPLVNFFEDAALDNILPSTHKRAYQVGRHLVDSVVEGKDFLEVVKNIPRKAGNEVFRTILTRGSLAINAAVEVSKVLGDEDQLRKARTEHDEELEKWHNSVKNGDFTSTESVSSFILVASGNKENRVENLEVLVGVKKISEFMDGLFDRGYDRCIEVIPDIFDIYGRTFTPFDIKNNPEDSKETSKPTTDAYNYPKEITLDYTHEKFMRLWHQDRQQTLPHMLSTSQQTPGYFTSANFYSSLNHSRRSVVSEWGGASNSVCNPLTSMKQKRPQQNDKGTRSSGFSVTESLPPFSSTGSHRSGLWHCSNDKSSAEESGTPQEMLFYTSQKKPSDRPHTQQHYSPLWTTPLQQYYSSGARAGSNHLLNSNYSLLSPEARERGYQVNPPDHFKKQEQKKTNQPHKNKSQKFNDRGNYYSIPPIRNMTSFGSGALRYERVMQRTQESHDQEEVLLNSTSFFAESFEQASKGGSLSEGKSVSSQEDNETSSFYQRSHLPTPDTSYQEPVAMSIQKGLKKDQDQRRYIEEQKKFAHLKADLRPAAPPVASICGSLNFYTPSGFSSNNGKSPGVEKHDDYALKSRYPQGPLCKNGQFSTKN